MDDSIALSPKRSGSMKQSVIHYVLSRLYQLGITEVFGVPGDYAFPMNDAIDEEKHLRWIGCSNELNAAYAADGYARLKGVAAVNTTYAVGELSALNAIAGAYAEHLPVFHLVGMPNTTTQKARALVHHTLGNGEFDLFYRLTEHVVGARAIITPQNCAAETERLIAAAMYQRRPVYMAFPADAVNRPVLDTATPLPPPGSDPSVLEAAVNAMVEMVTQARTACILPGFLVARANLREEMMAVVDHSGLPFATMFNDKSTLDETHSSYMGMYDGRLMNPDVRAFVENSDCILGVGALLTDFNSGAFTARIDRAKSINILYDHVRVGHHIFNNIGIKDVLQELAKRLPHRSDVNGPKVSGLGEPQGKKDEKITAEYLYPRWEQFLRPNDTLIAETGTASLGMAFARMPAGSVFHNQTLWGSIGWATPAAFGAALAAPHRRTVLITGEGSHQLTVQEVGQFSRYGLKPIIFVLNNHGYLIERLLCKDGEKAYNDLAAWNYQQVPAALGCEHWFVTRATTCGELDQAIARAEECDTAAYIEVVTDKYVAPPLALQIHEARRTLYMH
jgi:indolepyruvate decarboxylase